MPRLVSKQPSSGKPFLLVRTLGLNTRWTVELLLGGLKWEKQVLSPAMMVVV